MHDIFISYAKVDHQIARTIAEALNKEGFEVWWDVDIPTGSTFDAVIEQAVADAKCVIVLWSENSTKSEWVHVEAAEGKARNILIPILISDADIPFAFRRRQTADLRPWLKDKNDSAFERILVDIRAMCSPSKQNPKTEDEIITPMTIKPIAKQPSVQAQPHINVETKDNTRKSTVQNYKRIGGLLLIIAVLGFTLQYMLSAKSDIPEIGDNYAGGIVFYVDSNGSEVKICSESDLGTSNWFEAKALCESYNGGGHADWYLPSKEELNLIYTNLLPIGLGNFSNDWYWSSTETDGQGWEQVFPEGYQQNDGGGNESSSSVRAIRLVKLNIKKIGDEYAGGIIFQLDSLGQHGKVCSKLDIGPFNWYDAKTQCEDYSDGEYNDWYLPSRNELNLLYSNLAQQGIGDFKDDWYWSSTDTDGKAWEQQFGEGDEQNDGGGNDSYSMVRPVRSF